MITGTDEPGIVGGRYIKYKRNASVLRFRDFMILSRHFTPTGQVSHLYTVVVLCVPWCPLMYRYRDGSFDTTCV